MRHWFDWRFILPRLLCCVIVALTVQLTIGLVARSVVLRRASELIGANASAKHARVSVTNGRVVLSQLSLHELPIPLAGKCTADCCEIELAPGSLLHGTTVVRHCRVTGIQFSDPLRTSGDKTDVGPFVGARPEAVSTDRVTKTCASLHAIGSQQNTAVPKLPSIELAENFTRQFNARLAALANRSALLEQGTASLESDYRNAATNVLRHRPILDTLPTRTSALRNEVNVIAAVFEQLPLDLDQQRRAIVAARRHDEELLRRCMAIEPIDHQHLNEYLLSDVTLQTLHDAAAWLSVLRTKLLSPSERSAGRGTDLVFAGMKPSPRLVVNTLDLNGHVAIGGQNVPVAGQVLALSSAPSLHNSPISVRLSGKSDCFPMEIRATLDRTNGRKRDELFVDAAALRLPRRVLGSADGVQLTLSPCQGSLSLSLTVDAETCSGTIQLVQQDVKIASSLATDETDTSLASSLDQTLAELNSLATRVTIDGSTDKPKCTLWSNLGPAVAESLHRAIDARTSAQIQVALSDARRSVDMQLAEAERQLAQQQQAHADRTAMLPERLDAIARAQLGPVHDEADRIGTRLPGSSMHR